MKKLLALAMEICLHPLRNLMLDNGFIPLESEWWHYTLKDEPYPDTYFNMEVKSDGN